MSEGTGRLSASAKARMAGGFFVLTMVTAAVSEGLMHGKLGYWADAVEMLGMLLSTVMLFLVLRAVNRPLALVAICINLVGLALEAAQYMPRGVGVGLAMHGVYCLLIGYLIMRADFMPRILGALMVVGSLGWITYLLPGLSGRLAPYNLAAGIALELAVMVCLLAMGVNEPRWNAQNGARMALRPEISRALDR
jgi:hypothetical protein